jgi:hypothetical protein
MDTIADLVELISDLRDASNEIVSEMPEEKQDLDVEIVRYYYLGLCDAYASIIAYLVGGSPTVAVVNNMRVIWELIETRKEQNG